MDNGCGYASRFALYYCPCMCVGLPLVYFGGWEMILVGFACVVFCFLYTISFSYIGLGDVLVLVFFGLVPVCMTYWLVSPPTPLMSIPWPVIVLSIACGLIIDTLLVVNNYRDIDNDRRAGKRTLIVRIGERADCCSICCSEWQVLCWRLLASYFLIGTMGNSCRR